MLYFVTYSTYLSLKIGSDHELFDPILPIKVLLDLNPISERGGEWEGGRKRERGKGEGKRKRWRGEKGIEGGEKERGREKKRREGERKR